MYKKYIEEIERTKSDNDLVLLFSDFCMEYSNDCRDYREQQFVIKTVDEYNRVMNAFREKANLEHWEKTMLAICALL